MSLKGKLKVFEKEKTKLEEELKCNSFFADSFKKNYLRIIISLPIKSCLERQLS